MSSDRLLVIISVIVLAFFALIAHLFTIQVVDSEELRYFARKQQTAIQEVPAERGRIFDRQNHLLVYNSNDVSFFVDTKLAAKKNKTKKIANLFAEHFGKSADYYINRMENASRRNVCLEAKVEASKALPLKTGSIDGLYFEEDPTRVYQYGSLASHLLGYVNSKYYGMDGVERVYDDVLSGENGSRVVQRDALGGVITVIDGAAKPARPGGSIQLTIDRRIQSVLEEELESGLERVAGKWAVGIIVDPNTGEIIAMANKNDYDANNIGQSTTDDRRNKAITDLYEPGSTFKSVVLSALLDQKLCTADEMIFVENGRWKYRTITIRDSHSDDWLTVRGVLSHSSNIGMAKLSDRIDEETLYKYIRGFGFGNVTNSKLPGERQGQLMKPNEWGWHTRPTISYGYGVGVTPLQLAMAYAAIVNGGKLFEPHVVNRLYGPGGALIEEIKPEMVRQVITPATSAMIKDFMVEAVEEGTGKNARINGISVGGKTGTSRHYGKDEGYGSGKYNSSFIGFLPAENPQYVCLILVHAPVKQYYGGSVAAPIFKNVFEKVKEIRPELQHYQKSPDTSIKLVFTSHRGGESSHLAFADNAELSPPPASRRDVMPDLRGKSLRSAAKILTYLEMTPVINGSGKVMAQTIKPGTPVEPGMKCSLSGESVAFLRGSLY